MCSWVWVDEKVASGWLECWMRCHSVAGLRHCPRVLMHSIYGKA